MDDYQTACQCGRDRAAALMREVASTGNIPALVREIQIAANDRGGYGVGFMFAIGERISK
jgi:hypothetical protein